MASGRTWPRQVAKCQNLSQPQARFMLQAWKGQSFITAVLEAKLESESRWHPEVREIQGETGRPGSVVDGVDSSSEQSLIEMTTGSAYHPGPLPSSRLIILVSRARLCQCVFRSLMLSVLVLTCPDTTWVCVWVSLRTTFLRTKFWQCRRETFKFLDIPY